MVCVAFSFSFFLIILKEFFVTPKTLYHTSSSISTKRMALKKRAVS